MATVQTTGALTMAQLLTLAAEPFVKRTVQNDPSTGEYNSPAATGYIWIAPIDNPATGKPTKITTVEYRQRIARAAAIMYAESGGHPDAKNTNGTDSSAPGSHDRGVWQFNDQAHADVTDMMAYDPSTATEIAYQVSAAEAKGSRTIGYVNWHDWTGSKGLLDYGVDDRGNPTPYKLAVDEYQNELGQAIPTDSLPGFSGLGDIFKQLFHLLSFLTNAAWWRRIGIGVAGVLLVVVAIVLAVKK